MLKPAQGWPVGQMSWIGALKVPSAQVPFQFEKVRPVYKTPLPVAGVDFQYASISREYALLWPMKFENTLSDTDPRRCLSVKAMVIRVKKTYLIHRYS